MRVISSAFPASVHKDASGKANELPQRQLRGQNHEAKQQLSPKKQRQDVTFIMALIDLEK